MALYLGIARKLVIPGYEMVKLDVTHPPATSWLIAQFYQLDPSLFGVMVFQVVVASLIPLAVGGLAWVAFDQRCAAWAVAISSVYFYHVEYAGFFLSEVYMMFLIPACMACYLLATTAKTGFRRATFAIVCGLVFVVAVAFKTVAGPALVGFFAVHWLLTTGRRKPKTLALLAMILSSAPGFTLISQRCTKANGGTFCLQSNKSASDFLLGHYDRVSSIQWSDATFGSPGAVQHGYSLVRAVPFSITDKDQNMATAWDWIFTHKLEAVVLSFEHVFDMFAPNPPWPTTWMPEWPIAQAHMYLFIVFLIWPSCLLLFDIATVNGPLALLRSIEFAIACVLGGVSLGVFIATGEPRYRLPFDCVFIVLGVQFYRRMLARHGWRLLRRRYRPRPQLS
jgi:4-amino-4-deoxy-L-arabinose transferase-like glycosyltransferase